MTDALSASRSPAIRGRSPCCWT